MPSKPIIFLDLDGVCVDFVGAALKLCGAPEGFVATKYDFFTDLFLSEADFWRLIDKAGWRFWSELPEYPWLDEMLKALKKQGRVIFLTAPSSNPLSSYGKVKWFKTKFGPRFGDFILTNQKDLLAKDDSTILIDDSPSNYQKWGKAGGSAFLFPQPWNESLWNPIKDGWKVT
jgi:5'(3')-deoxyribonucleotidase